MRVADGDVAKLRVLMPRGVQAMTAHYLLWAVVVIRQISAELVRPAAFVAEEHT